MTDAMFDLIFPATHRVRSWLHWTPVDVAARAVALLAPTPRHRVLDVGSGVGKLCLVGATTSQATWVGIEQDLEMVLAARAAAVRLHVEHRARFVHGSITAIDWSHFDSFYLFNPFAELLTPLGDLESQRGRFVDAVQYVQRQLACSAAGTRVVTYHGFGGDFPPGFELVHREPARDDELCLWVHHTR